MDGAGGDAKRIRVALLAVKLACATRGHPHFDAERSSYARGFNSPSNVGSPLSSQAFRPTRPVKEWDSQRLTPAKLTFPGVRTTEGDLSGRPQGITAIGGGPTHQSARLAGDC